MAYKARKRKVKKNVPEGQAHIHATFNNTIISITDPAGNAISWSAPGAVGFHRNLEYLAFPGGLHRFGGNGYDGIRHFLVQLDARNASRGKKSSRKDSRK